MQKTAGFIIVGMIAELNAHGKGVTKFEQQLFSRRGLAAIFFDS
jgi:hypothetical protein